MDGKKTSTESNETTASPATAAAPPSDPDPINSVHLQSLMDMGFSREHCLEALNHTGGLEQATEYLLSNPSPLIRVQVTFIFIRLRVLEGFNKIF